MAHEVEQMVSVREVPWHGLGKIVDQAMTAKDAMVLGGLDWDVDLLPMYVRRSEGAELEEIAGRKALLRATDGRVYNIVTDAYAPIQNYKAFEFLDGLVGDNSAHYETAGSLNVGATVFLTAKIPRDIKVGGVDPVDLYLVVTSSHDSSKAFTAMVTPVRVVCMNTLNYALAGTKQSWTIKHTEKADGRIAEAREALGLTLAHADAFSEEAERMINAEITKAEFEEIVNGIVPAKSNDDSSRQVRMAMIGTLDSSKTIADEFRMTRWGAINAVAEYLDWIQPLRTSRTRTIEEQRTERAWFGAGSKMKQKAYDLLAVGS